MWPFRSYRIFTFCGFETRFRLFAWMHERTCEICTPVEKDSQ